MRLGVHMLCVHEFPSLVGPPRHECEFALMFGDGWTPQYLQSGPTNLVRLPPPPLAVCRAALHCAVLFV